MESSCVKFMTSVVLAFYLGVLGPNILASASTSTDNSEEIIKTLTPTASKLVSSVVSQYEKDCLKIGIDIYWPGTPAMLLQDDDQGFSILRQLKDSTVGVSEMNCMMLLLNKPPSQDLLNSLNPRGTTKCVFIVFSDNATQSSSMLLDSRLNDEENVVAIVHNADTWDVYIRKLYTSSGSPQVQRVLSWIPTEEIAYLRDIFPEQMKNFYGTKFEATTLEFRPFSDFIRQEGTRSVIQSPCLDFWILREIANSLNFTYDIVMPEDGWWGFLSPNVSIS